MRLESRQGIRLVLTGGGTGGHVYPLLAILEVLRERYTIQDVVYVGGAGRAEREIVGKAGLPFLSVKSAPFAGIGLFRLIGAVLKTARGMVQAALILMKHRPDLIVASGGYVSAPVCLAAFLLRPFHRTALVIHEQNVVPGRMNQVASLFAHLVMVSFEDTAYFLWNNRCVLTGYPVRNSLTERRDLTSLRASLGIPYDAFVIVAYGGSMGSRSINRAMAAVIPCLPAVDRPVMIIHSTGMGSTAYDAWQDTCDSLSGQKIAAVSTGTPVPGEELCFQAGRVLYRLEPYLHNIDDYLSVADLVIGRAGAGTIFEICAKRKPAIVIPKRNLPSDHQEHNAIRLARAGACEVLFERPGPDGIDYVDSGDLKELVSALVLDRSRLRRLGDTAGSHFYHRYRERICAAVAAAIDRSSIDYVPAIVEPTAVRILRQTDALISFLRKEPADSLYRRLYHIRAEQNLASDRWEDQNNGIKLVGALRMEGHVNELSRLFSIGNGFMRRNVMIAIEHFGVFHPCFIGLIRKGLADRYFETRAAAVSAAGQYWSQLKGDPVIILHLRRILSRRFERFDTRLQALLVAPRFLALQEYLTLSERFRFAANTRLRQAILDGLAFSVRQDHLHAGLLESIHRFIDDMPITTSDFSPRFKIRESYKQLQQCLFDAAASSSANDNATTGNQEEHP
jgi:UDP-N-acetylglucosamine--N-acetylmuramyl-(pentapeptide) pyrophosphoryl-undecaprenol N-acetylglucosamine transferase